MFEQLINKLKSTKKIGGVAIHILPSGEWEWGLCILENKNNVVDIVDFKQYTTSLDHLQKNLSADTPLFLCIDGKGILHKKQTDRHFTLQQMLPHAKSEEFYLQKYISESSFFASIIRKDHLHEILDQFEQLGFHVNQVSLGPFCIDTLIPLLDQPTEALEAQYYQVEINQHGILNLDKSLHEPSNQTYRIADTSINNEMLFAYASALAHFVPNDNILMQSWQGQERASKSWKAKRQYQLSLRVGLMAIFSLLLINFLVYSLLFNRHKTLKVNYEEHAVQIKQLENIKKEIQQNEILLNALNWQQSVQIATIADQLALCMPVSINLEELQVYPQDMARWKKEKQIVFDHGIIIIRGHCKQPLYLQKWTVRLKKMAWVDYIDTPQYQYQDADQKGSFELKIHLKKRIKV